MPHWLMFWHWSLGDWTLFVSIVGLAIAAVAFLVMYITLYITFMADQRQHRRELQEERNQLDAKIRTLVQAELPSVIRDLVKDTTQSVLATKLHESHLLLSEAREVREHANDALQRAREAESKTERVVSEAENVTKVLESWGPIMHRIEHSLKSQRLQEEMDFTLFETTWRPQAEALCIDDPEADPTWQAQCQLVGDQLIQRCRPIISAAVVKGSTSLISPEVSVDELLDDFAACRKLTTSGRESILRALHVELSTYCQNKLRDEICTLAQQGGSTSLLTEVERMLLAEASAYLLGRKWHNTR